MSGPVRVGLVVSLLILVASPAAAQSASSAAASSTASSTQSMGGDDLQVNPAEPDFTLGALPTALRMPAGKFSFRLTHRFSRPIAEGDAGDFFADFFGFDSSARIGLELRYGIRPGTQAWVHRTNDRAIQFAGQHEVLRQEPGRPFSVQAVAAVEGADNFSESFSGTLGAIGSHQFLDRAAVYAQPLVVFNANPDSAVNGQSDHTLLLGFGVRYRLGESRVYIVAEAAPQVAGYNLGVDHVSIGIEKRAGGHMFQLTIANALGTTFRQIARGGPNSDDWFIGFNLTRRFF